MCVTDRLAFLSLLSVMRDVVLYLTHFCSTTGAMCLFNAQASQALDQALCGAVIPTSGTVLHLQICERLMIRIESNSKPRRRQMGNT